MDLVIKYILFLLSKQQKKSGGYLKSCKTDPREGDALKCSIWHSENNYIRMIQTLMLEIKLKTFCFQNCIWAGLLLHSSSGYSDKIDRTKQWNIQIYSPFCQKRCGCLCDLYRTNTLNKCWIKEKKCILLLKNFNIKSPCTHGQEFFKQPRQWFL